MRECGFPAIMPGSVDTEFGGRSGKWGTEWKIAPEDIAEVVVNLLRMPCRTTVSRVEIRPSRPPGKGADLYVREREGTVWHGACSPGRENDVRGKRWVGENEYGAAEQEA